MRYITINRMRMNSL